MEIEIRINSRTDIPRLSQMTIKTNQFNVVTIRRTEDEISNLFDQADFLVYCFKLMDKYGDNGIVGYCEVKTKASQAELINFLMSCRVIGRNAENEFLTRILKDLKDHGKKTVTASWLKSPKNAICEHYYDNYGFTLIDGDQDHKIYQLQLDRIDLRPLDYFQVQWETKSL